MLSFKVQFKVNELPETFETDGLVIVGLIVSVTAIIFVNAYESLFSAASKAYRCISYVPAPPNSDVLIVYENAPLDAAMPNPRSPEGP